VKYEPKRFEIVHLRDDVAEQDTREELEQAIDDTRVESNSSTSSI